MNQSTITQPQLDPNVLLQELSQWHTAVLNRALQDKHQLESAIASINGVQTQQLVLAFKTNTLSHLRLELQKCFQKITETFEQVRSIWRPQVESADTLLFQSLAKSGIKEILVNGKQQFPIPAQFDLENLQFISLTTFTEQGLEILASNCPKLVNLSIGGGDCSSDVSDQALRQISLRLPKLQILTLWDTQVTAEGVRAAKQLAQLRSFTLESSRLTFQETKEIDREFSGIRHLFSSIRRIE